MEPVSILTVKNVIPLYKDNEIANRVELIQLEEVGFEIVVEKDLHIIGNKVVYIQPDYLVSDLDIFKEFIAPDGNEDKSLLGRIDKKPKRIRAIKFKLHKGDGIDVYSNGIVLLPSRVVGQIHKDVFLEGINLTEELGITKSEEDVLSPSFPSFIHETGEENINIMWDKIENNLKYPVILIGTQKIDGGSITIGVSDTIPEGFVCSRVERKPLFITKQTRTRKKTFFERLMFWTEPDVRVFESVRNTDLYCKSSIHILSKLVSTCKNTVLRGELNGQGCKGSGNKLNPAKKFSTNIMFFNIEVKRENGQFVKLPYYTFMAKCKELGIVPVPFIFEKTFNSKQEIIDTCESYFNKENPIEGIVLRTPDSQFSFKYMNNYYDSKK